jgi:uncharacterized protein
MSEPRLAKPQPLRSSRGMDACAFTWMGTPLVALASGALWWPAARLLAVADLHLGRAERLARRDGGLLPPYDTAATLDRLADAIAERDPAAVVALGDSFDDDACEPALADSDRARLTALIAGRSWTWIAGNHDPGPLSLPGEHRSQLALGALTFRHAPEPAAAPGEVAGHLHPKLRRTLGGHAISRPCFVLDARRLVLPAFGVYTGGLAIDHPALAGMFDPATARAILTGRPCRALPLAPSTRARQRA